MKCIFVKNYQGENGDQWINHLDLLYMGIAHQELLQHEEAIKCFDWALKNYGGFSDAEYYKSISLLKIGRRDEGKEAFKKAEAHFKQGRTFNQGNSKYEVYPYQINEIHFNALRSLKP